MNYPVWDVPFGSEWLIALIGILHVFISHFAIGGGLMLVLVEGRANRQDDPAIKGWLRRHTRFFVRLTLVVGAVTGVGIWFTIGLIAPEATSNLIHTFVWVWAIEWVFFLVEILSILVYASTWDTLPRAAHRMVGWVYFVAAYLSLVAVDGILAFQLTPGKWLETHSLWSAYFNPNFWPSLVARTLICAMLGGLYALLTLSWSEDRTLKADLGRYASSWVWPSALLLVPVMWWYVATVPKAQRDLLAFNTIVKHFSWLLFLASGLLVAITFALVWLRPRSLNRPVAALLMLLAFTAMGSTEWIREDLREPYLISGYVYINGVPVRQLESARQKGLLASSLWVSERAITPGNEARVGAELFRIACSACHLPRRGFNALGPKLVGLDSTFIGALAYRADQMRGGMPPFPGKPDEAKAIGRYLASCAPAAPVSNDGQAVWERRCGMCHTVAGAYRPVAKALAGQSQAEVADIVANIDSLNDKMPGWTGNDIEREALAKFLAEQTKAPAAGGAP